MESIRGVFEATKMQPTLRIFVKGNIATWRAHQALQRLSIDLADEHELSAHSVLSFTEP